MLSYPRTGEVIMNIILLSGGSGKRLWPLSNNVRSKQFIQLFKNENGEYESMVQRMYRHILEINKDTTVTVATSKTQVSELKNQLGEDIGISIEPCRKDTFPAIALAVEYLADVQGVSDDEVVVVCPVDPYVEKDYFKALNKIAEVAKKGEASLVLLGREPDEPSEKYGYIIPASKEAISPVKTFKEKPTKEVAAKYIAEGALWNMGVFAFKLGYVRKKAHELIDYDDYDDFYLKYASLKGISFDYAVVEHEPNIQVVRFGGTWTDLGTWESLTDKMEEKTIGKVVLKDCENTRVINELDIPIVALSLKDTLVAASSDGILVSPLDKANGIKPVLESLETGEVRYAEKSWGKYQVIDVTPESLVVRADIKAGHRMSYHSHARRDEVWTIIAGSGTTIVDGMSQHAHPGDVIAISAGCRHTVIAEEDLSIIEVQLGKEINVNDKQKFDYEQ